MGEQIEMEINKGEEISDKKSSNKKNLYQKVVKKKLKEKGEKKE